MNELRDPTAVMGRRILAYFIDGFVLAAAFVVPFLLLAESTTVDRLASDPDVEATYLNGVLRVFVGDTQYRLADSDITTVYGVALGVMLLFLVITQGLWGWTPGKLLTGIRTVRADGRACGIGRAILRWLLWVVDAFPYVGIPLVGGICALATTGHKRVGDMVAGTYVIQRGYVGEPVVPEGEPVYTGARSWDPTPAAEGASVTGAQPASTAPAPTYEPQWDAARGAYLQWDPRRQVWLQYDDDAQEWKPIS